MHFACGPHGLSLPQAGDEVKATVQNWYSIKYTTTPVTLTYSQMGKVHLAMLSMPHEFALQTRGAA